MGKKSRVVLKVKFEAGGMPTEMDFADFIDSVVNLIDDQVTIRNVGEGDESARYVGVGSVDPESPISVRNRTKSKNLLGFEDQNGIEKWVIEIDPESGGQGLNITEKGVPISNIFIESGGKVGVGTSTPEKKLDVKGDISADRFEGIVNWKHLEDVPLTKLVPNGVILMWSGSIDKIPNGWALCDGKNATPDLRNRFIVGASDEYTQGDIGGLNEVELSIGQMPAHNHGGSTGNPDRTLDHSHNFQRRKPWDSGDNDKNHDRAHDTLENAATKGVNGSNPQLKHSHSIGTQGGSQPHENRPPYYALCFIMKTYETTS